MLQTKRADFSAIAERFHISPVTARIIRNRDVVGEEAIRRYLDGGMEDLHNPHLLKDMDRTVEILKGKIKEGVKIRIVGDYDIDGICATYLLYQGIRRCGGRVDYQIPERIKDGYGINESIIRRAGGEGIDTLITCDNGIAALEQIRMAKELGMTVLVTDHHEVPLGEGGEELPPPADAIVNPKQRACAYPFKGICGGVVAYKLVQALYEACNIPIEEWEAMLEFAAIATVGDVMRLQDENRILVRLGLKQMARTRSLGLRKLVEACGLDIRDLTAYHIGFVVGPCLNASGRLQTAKLALELLLCGEGEEAARMAGRLRELNEERKEMTLQGTEEALRQVEEKYAKDPVLVVFLPDCHESVAGIIAGRVREAWNRPTFVLTPGEECVKGSGRSIEAYHMYKEMCGVQDLFLKFGGHPMAAGFSIRECHVEELRRRLNGQATLKPEDFIPRVWIDVAMPLEYISEGLMQELKRLEPFGQGNEKPQFAQKGLRIRSARVLGKNRNAVKLALVTEQGLAMDGMLFTEGDRFMEELGRQTRIDVVYYPDVNEYNGQRSLQVVIREYKLHP
ncbi:single-stranded-DNA-specific exonuclease RecJ [Clostridiaceae bacterium]|nr:single-stranded-DNA-specific exonuclease RecJ [Clostridiaceae bacterium]RKI14150.1 single-stranded-DNA-specific exonuclease RecJ [bacterium 1XD21-70]